MQGMKFQELMSLANEITRELGISRKVNNSEPFVVDGRQLSEIMIRWRDGFLKAQGYEEGIHEGVEYGAQKFLHDKTGMNLRTIGRVMNCELAYISESKADALLTAIDKHEMLDLGEIRRIPNPSWTPSALVEYLQESGVM